MAPGSPSLCSSCLLSTTGPGRPLCEGLEAQGRAHPFLLPCSGSLPRFPRAFTGLGACPGAHSSAGEPSTLGAPCACPALGPMQVLLQAPVKPQPLPEAGPLPPQGSPPWSQPCRRRCVSAPGWGPPGPVLPGPHLWGPRLKLHRELELPLPSPPG